MKYHRAWLLVDTVLGLFPIIALCALSLLGLVVGVGGFIFSGSFEHGLFFVALAVPGVLASVGFFTTYININFKSKPIVKKSFLAMCIGAFLSIFLGSEFITENIVLGLVCFLPILIVLRYVYIYSQECSNKGSHAD